MDKYKMSINKKLFKHKWLVILGSFFPILLFSGLWQRYMAKKESNLFSPPGELYHVNGHDMHLYSIGDGNDTIVFIAGSGTPCAFTDFYILQNELQEHAKTISFDHAGYGWSEKTEKPRMIDIITEELHELLEKAGELPPYILVGHSLASLEAIRFSQKYPDEVKGIILIDGGNPYFYAEDSEVKSIAVNRFTAALRTTGIIRAFGNIGVVFPFTSENLRYHALPDEIRKIDISMYYNKVGDKNNIQVIRRINENAKTVINGGYLNDISLVILSSDSGYKWDESQQQFLEWSNISYQETINNAGHYIHWTHKDIVIDKIVELINRKE